MPNKNMLEVPSCSGISGPSAIAGPSGISYHSGMSEPLAINVPIGKGGPRGMRGPGGISGPLSVSVPHQICEPSAISGPLSLSVPLTVKVPLEIGEPSGISGSSGVGGLLAIAPRDVCEPRGKSSPLSVHVPREMGEPSGIRGSKVIGEPLSISVPRFEPRGISGSKVISEPLSVSVPRFEPSGISGSKVISEPLSVLVPRFEPSGSKGINEPLSVMVPRIEPSGISGASGISGPTVFGRTVGGPNDPYGMFDTKVPNVTISKAAVGGDGARTPSAPIPISGTSGTIGNIGARAPSGPTAVSGPSGNRSAASDGRNGNNRATATETTPLVIKDDVEGNQERAQRPQNQGLSAIQAVFLISSEIIGGGVLVLPRALTRTGWIGIPIIMIACLMAAFNSKRLTDCWALVEARDPELLTKKMNPYAIIAEQALGKKWSAAVSLGLVVTQFGVSVVYLLLAAEVLEQMFLSLVPSLTVCLWYIIVAGVMTPMMLLITPKDLTFLGIFSFVSALMAYVLYFIEFMKEIHFFVFRYGAHDVADFFNGVGMIMFAFGGASSFPTVNNDMAQRNQYNKSLHYSFLGILGLYLAMGVAGYSVLGDAVLPNFAASLKHNSLTLVANIIMTVHLVSSFIIVINPVCVEMEMLYGTPRGNILNDSLGNRVLVRISIMAAVLFIGETIPRFYTILALVGGSTIALLTFILPSYCYLSLTKSEAARTENDPTPRWMKVVCWEVMAVGGICSVFCIYSALDAIFRVWQAVPCYL